MGQQVYDETRMRQACLVNRRARTIAVVSLLGGAVSVLPFAVEWFGLSTRAANLLLFSSVVASFGFSLAITASSSLRRAILTLAGPPERPAHALVLVAVLAPLGLTAMLAAAALVGSL
jgi:hypothetical protein